MKGPQLKLPLLVKPKGQTIEEYDRVKSMCWMQPSSESFREHSQTLTAINRQISQKGIMKYIKIGNLTEKKKTSF